jgi:hypothetical protein
MEESKGMNQEEIITDLLSDYHKAKAVEYKPSRQEALSRYEINIQFMSRGCVIRVGCKTIPFSSTEEAIYELQKYFDKPYDTQMEWDKKLL